MKRRTIELKGVICLCCHCNKVTEMKWVSIDQEEGVTYYLQCSECKNPSPFDFLEEKRKMEAGSFMIAPIVDKKHNIVKGLYHGSSQGFSFIEMPMSSAKRSISVIIDPMTSSKQEIIQALLCLSELYRSVGGDGLIIRDQYVVAKELELA